MRDTLKFRFGVGCDENGKALPPTFYINKDKGTVVCRIRGVLTGFSGEIENILVDSSKATVVSVEDDIAIMEFTGKAKCCPGDTFDEKVGKQIAESRAKMKVYATLQQIASKAAKFYNQQATVASDTAEKYLRILSTEVGRVDKLADIRM